MTIVGSRGNFCSGTMIAPNIALTAAHCVPGGATYKIVEYDAQRTPQLRDIAQIATHPQFNLQTMLAHRATADVALLRLASPVAAARQPPPVGAPLHADQRRRPLHRRGHRRHACAATARAAASFARQISLRPAGPETCRSASSIRTGEGKREGLGACTGDSGGPVFEDQQGRAVVIGVVSWSTGPNGTAGCGGMTGVTPLSLYRDWILQTARSWGAAL